MRRKAVMKNALMIIGNTLIIFGLVDFLGSYVEFDLWSEIGIQLPEWLRKYSSYIEFLAGYLLFKAGDTTSAIEPKD